jgi:hypothetical protein
LFRISSGGLHAQCGQGIQEREHDAWSQPLSLD